MLVQGEIRLYRSAGWKYTEDLMRSFFGYGEPERSPAAVKLGDVVDLTSAADCFRFKDGHWGEMDYTGTWTDTRVPSGRRISAHCSMVARWYFATRISTRSARALNSPGRCSKTCAGWT